MSDSRGNLVGSGKGQADSAVKRFFMTGLKYKEQLGAADSMKMLEEAAKRIEGKNSDATE